MGFRVVTAVLDPTYTCYLVRTCGLWGHPGRDCRIRDDEPNHRQGRPTDYPATPSPRSVMELLWEDDVGVKARTGKVRLSVHIL